MVQKQKRVCICVIDGQGGGIGSAIIKRLKEEFGERVEIIALGTNSIATAAMMKARANRGATGENAIVRMVSQADYLIGPISIVMANAMMGELTPLMAEAIASTPAHKILLPLSQEKVFIVGVTHQPLPHLVEDLVSKELKERIDV
jgi:NAD(P)-dependent dehydrogenase (short-subunit alcohol dehydrogenase family)